MIDLDKLKSLALAAAHYGHLYDTPEKDDLEVLNWAIAEIERLRASELALKRELKYALGEWQDSLLSCSDLDEEGEVTVYVTTRWEQLFDELEGQPCFEIPQLESEISGHEPQEVAP